MSAKTHTKRDVVKRTATNLGVSYVNRYVKSQGLSRYFLHFFKFSM